MHTHTHAPTTVRHTSMHSQTHRNMHTYMILCLYTRVSVQAPHCVWAAETCPRASRASPAVMPRQAQQSVRCVLAATSALRAAPQFAHAVQVAPHFGCVCVVFECCDMFYMYPTHLFSMYILKSTRLTQFPCSHSACTHHVPPPSHTPSTPPPIRTRR